MWCWIYQWMISAALDGGSSPGRLTRRHIARCAVCRSFQLAALRLDRQLRRQASSAPRPSVRQRGVEGAISFRRKVLAAAGGLAACLVIILALAWPTQQKPEPVPAPPDSTGSILDAPLHIGAAVEQVAWSVPDRAIAFAEQEMLLLADDAKATAKELLKALPIPTTLQPASDL